MKNHLINADDLTPNMAETEESEAVDVCGAADAGRSMDPPGPRARHLTPRQREILMLLARGFYYKEIGEQLGISRCTVRAHLHSAYQKLRVKSRARAVIKFHEQTRALKLKNGL